MIDKVLQAKNLTKAYRQVIVNKGSAGVDGINVRELRSYIDQNRTTIAIDILQMRYVVQPIRGVEIPKPNGKKYPQKWTGGFNRR